MPVVRWARRERKASGPRKQRSRFWTVSAPEVLVAGVFETQRFDGGAESLTAQI